MTPLSEEKRVSRFQRLNSLLREFTPVQRMMLYGFTILMGLSAFVLLAKANDLISVEIPAPGGSLVEGSVGTPRFMNPLLAASQSDQDLTTLIYSGLLREQKDGSFTPDLASDYDISADGTVYTFHLKPDLAFHDGKPLTADDILFTISLAQNPDVKSTRRADWEGVVVKAPDTGTIVFTLPHAYAPFLENTTMGILPKHVWQSVPAQEFPFSPSNTHPVGSGPYRIKDVKTDTTGAPTEYRLVPFNGFVLGTANITHITYRVYASEDALMSAVEGGDIDSFVSSSPKDLPRTAADDANLIRVPLTRVFGIFLNQNHASVLANAAVRAALDAAVDKRKIVSDILGGYGSTLDGPIPPGLFSDTSTSASSTETDADHAQAARDILTKGGWKFSANATSTDAAPPAGRWIKDKTTLSITLATADTDELVATAHAVADAWRAAGIQTQVQIYPLQELNSTVLRPRAYDAVLFGEVVGRSLDVYAFWHSSQRNDPGLNLALYANAVADKALADARAETDPTKRQQSYLTFLEAVRKDKPAVFLYSPDIVYLVPTHVQGIDIGTITTPSERFPDVYEWYRDTERVWDIFAPKIRDSSLN